MPPLKKIPEMIKRLLTQPTDELSRWQRALRFSVNLSRYCWGELSYDRAPQMASALTYHTLFSLPPMIVVMLVVMHGFKGMETYNEKFQQNVVEFLLPSSLLAADVTTVESSTVSSRVTFEVGDQELIGTPSDDSEVSSEESVAQARAREQAELRRELASRIQEVMNYLAQINFGGIGVVGLLVFIYGATALLSTVERCFNIIFGLEHQRPWYIRLPLYYTVITLGPLVLIAGQVMQQGFLNFLTEGSWGSWLAGPMVVLSPLLTTWMVLFLMFVLLPDARVHRRQAAIGSFVSAVLWVLGKEIFAIYVSRAAATTLYGALGLFPLFLLWIWLTWLVVLFGLELCYTLQASGDRDYELKHQQLKKAEGLVIDTDWVVPIGARIAQAFRLGQVCDIDDMSQEISLPARAVRRIIQMLESQGIVHLVAGPDGKHGYSLAKPAESIRVADLLALGRGMTPQIDLKGCGPAGPLFDELQTAQDTHADRTAATLADLAPDSSSDQSVPASPLNRPSI